jgi:hypothetical protein
MKYTKEKPAFVYYLALWGCLSTGLVYTAIGVFAILSFFKIKEGGADEGSLLVFLDKFLIGKLFIWIILLGMLGYIAWRFYETIQDPYGYGKKLKGILRRTVIVLSSLADALIAYSAIMALLGLGGIEETGQPTAQREIIGNMFQENWGQWVIITIGIFSSITAIVQFGYVMSRAYMERLDINHLATWKKTSIHVLAWAGHFARGIIMGIIGFFFIKGAILKNAQYVVNTDKAFDFIGDHVGHLYFIIVAIGTICYGLFMFVFGIYYDTDKDK